MGVAVIPVADRSRDLRVLSLAGVGAGAVLPALPAVGVLCPLRRVTGIPCPLCGMCTAAAALYRLDPAAAVAANPLAALVVLALVVAWLPVTLRATATVLADVPGVALVRRRAGPASTVVLLGSWLYQLHRFGHL
jgi:hypothetical protein